MAVAIAGSALLGCHSNAGSSPNVIPFAQRVEVPESCSEDRYLEQPVLYWQALSP